MLKHDEQGFLTGEGGTSRSEYAAKLMQVWANIAQGVRATVRNTDAIRSDLRAILAAFNARDAGTEIQDNHPRSSQEVQAKQSSAPLLVALPKAIEAEATARTNAANREKTPTSKPVGRKEPSEKSLAFTRVYTNTNPVKTTTQDSHLGQQEKKIAPSTTTTSLPKEAKNKDHIRGENGRFVKRDDLGIVTPTTREEDPEQKSSGMLSGVIGRLADAVNETAQGAEQADPALQAMREIATPMARGWELISGGDSNKRQESWLRRIFSRLGNMGDNAKNTGKETNKKLAEIEKKPAGNGGADGGGLLAALASILPMILPLLTKIPLLGPVLALGGKLISSVAGALLGAGAGLFKKKPAGGAPAGKVPAGGAPAGGAPAGGVPAGVEAGTVAKKSVGAASKLVNFGKGILRKIPLIGALLAGAGAASEIYDSETSKETRRTKDKTAGKAVGGLGGTIAGGAAGFKIGALAGSVFGPIGTAIGGVIGAMVGAFLGDQAGQIIGKKFGEWTNDLRAYDIPGKITAAWNSTVKWFTDSWDKGIAEFRAIPEKITAAWNGFVKMVAERFGIKLPTIDGGAKKQPDTDGAKKPPEVPKKPLSDATDKAKEMAVKLANDAKEGVKKLAGKAVNAGNEAVQQTVQAVKGGGKWMADNTTLGKGAQVAGRGVSALVDTATPAVSRAYDTVAATTGSVLEKVMPKGYRHKALFDGIKGGKMLTNEGRYTDDEAAKIIELKKSGADTSASGKGGMSIDLQEKIAAQAKKAGLDPLMMQRIAAMESGGNANAVSPTGAIGIYQFTGRTASGVGIRDRFDVDQNIEGGMRLTNENIASLKASKLPVTGENLYMMHQLGPTAAKEVIRGAAEGRSKSDMSKATQEAMNLNYGANSKTAADYIATNKRAMDDRYALVTKVTGGTKTAALSTKPNATQQPETKPVSVVSNGSPPSQPIPKIAPAVVVHAEAPKAPPAQAATAVPDYKPPQVAGATSVASNTKQGLGGMPDVSQNVSNTTIAHIVTGGIGMGG